MSPNHWRYVKYFIFQCGLNFFLNQIMKKASLKKISQNYHHFHDYSSIRKSYFWFTNIQHQDAHLHRTHKVKQRQAWRPSQIKCFEGRSRCYIQPNVQPPGFSCCLLSTETAGWILLSNQFGNQEVSVKESSIAWCVWNYWQAWELGQILYIRTDTFLYVRTKLCCLYCMCSQSLLTNCLIHVSAYIMCGQSKQTRWFFAL